MVKNWKALFAAAALTVTGFGAGAAFTQPASAQMYAQMRGDRGSDRDVVWVKARLENLIDQLQRDQHDYDGHRVAAIADMQRAREQLQAAIDYDRAHGH